MILTCEERLGYIQTDGGRAAAGFKGTCGDCGTRSAAIALSLPYKEVYDELNNIRKEFLLKSRSARMKKYYSGSVRDGTPREVMYEFMSRHGCEWTPMMGIGTGCSLHLDEMPRIGSYVVVLAGHYVCVRDGVICDTFRDEGDRCVYGYWRCKC